MQLSVKDTAAILDVPEKELYRLIQQGAVPVHKINEQYRFNRAELLEWATSHGMKVSPGILVEDVSGESEMPTFTDAVLAGGIEYGVEGDDKVSVLRSIVGIMKLPEEVDRDFLYEVLLARETLGSTGIGEGIAIPHVRNPVVLQIARPSVTLCFLRHPIDFSAIDGKAVNILFTLITPSVRTHLYLLSRLGFILRNPEVKELLGRQAPRELLMAAFARAEAPIPAAQVDGLTGSKPDGSK